jgi:hypothetical protein
LHLIETGEQRQSIRTGRVKQITLFTFPEKILLSLADKGILIRTSNGTFDVFNEEKFNEDLFNSIILAHLTTNKELLTIYQKAGIIANFAILFLLATLPNVVKQIENSGDLMAKLETKGFDSSYMQILPKSWMMEEIVEIYRDPLMKVIAFYLGGNSWVRIFDDIHLPKRIHQQLLTRLPLINSWKLGQKIRVMVPILINVDRILVDVLAESPGKE